MSLKETLDLVYDIGLGTSEYAFNKPNIREFIMNDDQHFDLIFAEQFYQEAFLMLAHKYKAPIVTLGTFGFASYMYPIMGAMSPWSHVPHEFMSFTDHMTFYERVYNVLGHVFEHFYRKYHYLPLQDEMAKKYFLHLPGPLPSVSELEKQISVIILNSHVPLSTPRPTVQGMVQVGGLHIKEPKPLPDELQSFLDGAKDGVIYFSLGTNLKSADLPQEKLKIFFNVFSEMKQRIVWKFENENIEGLPENVIIKKWMPQNDILAHKNVKVFITHGGLLGTQEGVFHNVPMLGVPIYCDQHLNMNKAKLGGYALSLEFGNITEVSLKWALNELLYNPTFSIKLDQVSKIFRDRPIPPLDEALYWIEYVIRFKGARQIRSAALDLPWYTLISLDVALFFALIAFIFIYLPVRILKMLFYKLFNVKKYQKLD